MIELASSVKKRPVKMLQDLGATGNFISDAMTTALKLQVQEYEDFHELTLTDGTVMLTTGFVQFMMNCGDYKGKIVSRVFPTYIRSAYYVGTSNHATNCFACFVCCGCVLGHCTIHYNYIYIDTSILWL